MGPTVGGASPRPSASVLAEARRFPWARGHTDPIPGDAHHLPHGTVLLVSVDPGGTRDSIWCAWPTDQAPPPYLGLRPAWGDVAARAMEDAVRITLRELPVPPHEATRAGAPRTSWTAVYVAHRGDGLDVVLDGDSFGLALLLGTAARLCALDLPSDVAALAAFGRDGAIRKVELLDRKLGILRERAPGVRRILVHPDQVTAVTQTSPDLAAVPVSSVREALHRLWPDLEAHLLAHWRNGANPAPRIEQLFRLTRGHAPVLLSWSAISAAAQALGQVARDLDDRRKAEFVERVARRHEGEEVEALPWDAEWLGALPRPIRLEVAAHYVQHGADVPTPKWPEIVSAGRRLCASRGESHLEDLKLRGALGRLLAAEGRWEEADRELRAAAECFLALGLEHEASHAVCEALRVLGIRSALGGPGPSGDAGAAGLDAWALRVLPSLWDDHRTGAVSRSFLRAAEGRALAQMGRFEAAAERLAPDLDDEDHLPRDPRISRLHWWARAEDALGREGEARALRERAIMLTGFPRTADAASGRDRRALRQSRLLLEMAACGAWRGDVDLRRRNDAQAALAALDPGEWTRLERCAAGSAVEPADLWRY